MADILNLYTKKSIYLMHVIEFIICTVLGLATWYFKETISNFFENSLFSNMTIYVLSLLLFMFGICGIICCLIGISKPKKLVMRIDNNGFETPEYGFVKWSDVTKLNLDNISGSNYITFNTKKPIENKMNNITNKMFSNPYVISLFYTGINAKKLYKLMQQHLI